MPVVVVRKIHREGRVPPDMGYINDYTTRRAD
jgi:hypothetical protein